MMGYANVHHQSVPTAVGFDVNISFDDVNAWEDMGSSVARPAITPPENTIDTPSHEITETNSTVLLDDTLRFATVTDEFLQPLAYSKFSIDSLFCFAYCR
jgi:hypothetical protein